MNCFITSTGSCLPGPAVKNEHIERHIGRLDGEEEVRRTVLRMNGITSRHYAQDCGQQPTSDVYQLACEAIRGCLRQRGRIETVSLLSSGATYSPLSGPGVSSILHSKLREQELLSGAVEINSHSGICTSAAAALVGAIRSVASGEHEAALCVGTEVPSNILKASEIDPIDDRDQHVELRNTQWFMTVFLRFMLSDGAGAFLLESQPNSSGPSFQVNWTFSRSFAHEAPLCMKLENKGARLSQNVEVLSRYLFPAARKFTAEAMQRHEDDLSNYKVILPHLSSFFFRRKLERVMQEFSSCENPVPYWTNLATAGNTGAASIFIMLDHYLKENDIRNGDKLLLFIPESGQFNFVMLSLTAVIQ